MGVEVIDQKPQQAASHREGAQIALLDIFASANSLPINLYEEREGRVVKIASQKSLDELDEPYCRAIQQFPEGRKACEQDQCVRAMHVMQAGEERLTLCHAGLYSQAVPIKVDGVTRAVVLYGEMRIADELHEQRSLANHQEAVRKLGVTDEQAERLGQLLLTTKRFAPSELEVVKATLPKVGAWFYRLFDEEVRLEKHVEKVTHELQTRLQSVLARTEILFLDMQGQPGLKQELKEAVGEVLNSALALSTVVHSLGEFLEEYRFARRPIAPLLYEAKRIYGAEARKRGVDIRVHLDPVDGRPPILEVSEDHLQYAFNNLVHNAVKYSFYGAHGRERYVRVAGYLSGRFYCIVFENYGVGILPKEIDEGLLFLDGYQGELTQGEYRTGSGKGLYFARRVIERHHGTIKVTSTPKGELDSRLERQPHLNQFSVCLPYEQPDEYTE